MLPVAVSWLGPPDRSRVEWCNHNPDLGSTLPSLKVPPIFLSCSFKKAFFNTKTGGAFKEGRVLLVPLQRIKLKGLNYTACRINEPPPFRKGVVSLPRLFEGLKKACLRGHHPLRHHLVPLDSSSLRMVPLVYGSLETYRTA